jgi:hypothetical protein
MNFFFKFAFMFAYSDDFPNAVRDYESFLSKKYPQKTILKMVGDRYKLTGAERTMLYRGIAAKEKAEGRFTKLIKEANLKGEIIYIDALNQLLTVSAYLLGRPVFLCYDGFLRDALELHGNAIGTLLPLRAFEIAITYLSKTESTGITFYFDSQVNGCKEYCDMLVRKLPDFIIQPEIILSSTVDKDLINQPEGLICTSDSAIIDKCQLNVFDLARNTLEYNFWPEFFDLKKITADSQI